MTHAMSIVAFYPKEYLLLVVGAVLHVLRLGRGLPSVPAISEPRGYHHSGDWEGPPVS